MGRSKWHGPAEERAIQMGLIKEEAPRERSVSLPSLDQQSLLSGAWDAVARSHADLALDALCWFWRVEWGKPDRGVVSGVKRRFWTAWRRQAVPVSTIAKAIRGMRHDKYQARDRYCDWNYVDEQWERWLDLYDGGPDGPFVWPKARAARGLRQWRGFQIPADYAPTPADERVAEQGRYVFLVDRREWADPADNPSGTIAAQDAKYGAGFNRPPERTKR